MVKSLKERLREILIGSNLVTKADLDKAIQIQKEKGGKISEILVKQGTISEKELMLVLSEQLDTPPMDLSKFKIDPEMIKAIPERVARYYQLIPISKIGNVLTVAMADPLNVFAMDDVRSLTGYEIKPIISTSYDILQAIESYYEAPMVAMKEILEGMEEKADIEVVKEEEEVDIGQISRDSEEAPIVKMVNVILAEALRKRASDIHLEPYEDKLRVRYRIDGNLTEALTPPKDIQNALLARLKIMANLDITERRLPQDGRFKVKIKDKYVDFRVSSLPISFGEKIVLRALDRSSLEIGLDELGFSPDPLSRFKKAIEAPYGMLLITGPTGCGKSTTLYSVLNKLNTPDRNVMTVEDPVEYQIEGITQLQTKPEIGLDFANGLKCILRQSPDVILVGEIRDFETADTAIKASLTGQLVFSTLHTNDACSATTRLMDMGVEPFLISSSLIMVTAQRLCRKICPNCKERYSIPKKVLDRVGIKLGEGEKPEFFKGKGCKMCNNTGYYGRMGTMEVLLIDDEIKKMILRGASSAEIEEYARAGGMKTLRENAIEKLKMGLTTLEEVLRITTEE